MVCEVFCSTARGAHLQPVHTAIQSYFDYRGLTSNSYVFG